VELDKGLVDKVLRERKKDHGLRQCNQKKKTKKDKWGAILVERCRRRQNDGGTVMQKAMKIKRRKNLEHQKDISFASMNVDYLNQVARDTNIRIGCNNDESARLINSLIADEKVNYDQFVDENPDIALPSNLDVEIVVEVEHV
jgi:hypothetical protein